MAPLGLLVVAATGCNLRFKDRHEPVSAQTADEAERQIASLTPRAALAQRESLRSTARWGATPGLRRAAIAALAYTAKDRESIPALAEAMQVEQDVEVLRRHIAAQAALRGPEGVEVLVSFWFKPAPLDVREDLRGVLLGCDPHLVDAAFRQHGKVATESLPGFKAPN